MFGQELSKAHLLSAHHRDRSPRRIPGPVRDGRNGSVEPFISVCIITRGRGPLLDACLRSLQEQKQSPPFELLVCCQADPSAAAVVRRRFPDAVIGLVEEAFVGGARNFLIARARGDILLFLDDDVTFGPGLLRLLADLAERHPDAAVFGGPNLTPAGSSRFQIVQGGVLGSILGTGPVCRRYSRRPSGLADERSFTLCNMAVRRQAMVDFPDTFIGGEENAVLTELQHQRTPMLYDSDLAVYHERRSKYLGFLQQMVKYGRGRGQLLAHHPSTARPLFIVPLLLIGWLVTLPVIAVVSPWWLLTAVAYLAAAGLGGAIVALRLPNAGPAQRVGMVPQATGLMMTVHLAYGVGIIRGLFTNPAAPESTWEDVTPEMNDLRPSCAVEG